MQDQWASYQIKDRNDVFNSYSITLVQLLNFQSVSLQLKKVNDTETIIDLSAVTGPQLSRMPATVNGMVDGFLSKVGQFLSGALVVKITPPIIQTPEQKRKGLINAILFLAIVLAGLIGLIYLIMK